MPHGASSLTSPTLGTTQANHATPGCDVAHSRRHDCPSLDAPCGMNYVGWGVKQLPVFRRRSSRKAASRPSRFCGHLCGSGKLLAAVRPVYHFAEVLEGQPAGQVQAQKMPNHVLWGGVAAGLDAGWGRPAQAARCRAALCHGAGCQTAAHTGQPQQCSGSTELRSLRSKMLAAPKCCELSQCCG